MGANSVILMVKTFLVSDTHFSHRNIIKYCNRPFANADEMNEELISRWNAVVGHDDHVYHLGDVTFEKDRDKAVWMLSRLKGKKHIVWGNHDRGFKDTIVAAGFTDCGPMHYINVPTGGNNNHQGIVLCHFAMRVWDRSHHGVIQCYGHSHGSLPPMFNQLDVGVDNAVKLLGEYRPFSVAEVIKFVSSFPKAKESVDHHTER